MARLIAAISAGETASYRGNSSLFIFSNSSR